MFEKEAEEIANKRCHEIMCFGHCSFSSPKHHRCGEWHREYNCAKEGIEFGYNKANEWHYVSKEGFPNKDDIYLIIRKDGLHLGDYCCGGDGDIDCQSWCDYPSEEEIQDDSVIAWKEIVLPELKESE